MMALMFFSLPLGHLMNTLILLQSEWLNVSKHPNSPYKHLK